MRFFLICSSTFCASQIFRLRMQLTCAFAALCFWLADPYPFASLFPPRIVHSRVYICIHPDWSLEMLVLLLSADCLVYTLSQIHVRCVKTIYASLYFSTHFLLRCMECFRIIVQRMLFAVNLWNRTAHLTASLDNWRSCAAIIGLYLLLKASMLVGSNRYTPLPSINPHRSTIFLLKEHFLYNNFKVCSPHTSENTSVCSNNSLLVFAYIVKSSIQALMELFDLSSDGNIAEWKYTEAFLAHALREHRQICLGLL